MNIFSSSSNMIIISYIPLVFWFQQFVSIPLSPLFVISSISLRFAWLVCLSVCLSMNIPFPCGPAWLLSLSLWCPITGNHSPPRPNWQDDVQSQHQTSVILGIKLSRTAQPSPVLSTSRAHGSFVLCPFLSSQVATPRPPSWTINLHTPCQRPRAKPHVLYLFAVAFTSLADSTNQQGGMWGVVPRKRRIIICGICFIACIIDR